MEDVISQIHSLIDIQTFLGVIEILSIGHGGWGGEWYKGLALEEGWISVMSIIVLLYRFILGCCYWTCPYRVSI